MNDFIDELAETCFGMTRAQAQRDKVCVKCHNPVFVVDEFDNSVPNPALFHSVPGVNEWGISGMCEKCFEEMFGDE